MQRPSTDSPYLMAPVIIKARHRLFSRAATSASCLRASRLAVGGGVINWLINQRLAIIIVSRAQLIDTPVLELTSNKNYNPSASPRAGPPP